MHMCVYYPISANTGFSVSPVGVRIAAFPCSGDRFPFARGWELSW